MVETIWGWTKSLCGNAKKEGEDLHLVEFYEKTKIKIGASVEKRRSPKG
jgi:hypothetical protein